MFYVEGIFYDTGISILWHLRCKYDFVLHYSFTERIMKNQSLHLHNLWRLQA